eukprot:TRINITY_DN2637_c0_g1_i1.p1 TRINITY_DN2637_c0_g1~~TRINITY_DN2637_c0_g1_i1.p1  ORF type:complete len:376 (+),score=138.93 TRINITY_DN2637_c0_g1_i1:291-1418(+)
MSGLDYRVASHSREKKITPATPKANTKTPMKFKRQTTPARQRNPRKTVDLKDAKEKALEFRVKTKRGRPTKHEEEEEEEEREAEESEEQTTRAEDEREKETTQQEEEEEEPEQQAKKKTKKAKASKKQKTSNETTTETEDDRATSSSSSGSSGTAITAVPISKAHSAIQEIVMAQCKHAKTEYDGSKKFVADGIDDVCNAFLAGLPSITIAAPAEDNDSAQTSSSSSVQPRVRPNSTNQKLRRQELSLKELTRRFETELSRWNAIERAYSSIAEVPSLKRDVSLSAEDQRLLHKLKEIESSGSANKGPTQAFTDLLSQAAQVSDLLLQLTRYQESADAHHSKVKSIITSTAFEPYLPDMQNPMKLIESLAGAAPF